MANFATEIVNAFIRVSTEFNILRNLVNGGATDLAALLTTNKTHLVAAINELHGAIGGAGATINDGAVSSSSVWSSEKVDAEIDAALATLVNTAPEALNTLNELAAALNDDPNFATTLTNLVGTKANDSDVVKLTGAQTIAGIKTFSSAPVVPDASFTIAKIADLQLALDAKVSLTALGDINTNFVAAFEAGLT